MKRLPRVSLWRWRARSSGCQGLGFLVFRVMGDLGLMELPRRKTRKRGLIRVRTSSDLVNRDFAATESNKFCVTDIIEDSTKEGLVLLILETKCLVALGRFRLRKRCPSYCSVRKRGTQDFPEISQKRVEKRCERPKTETLYPLLLGEGRVGHGLERLGAFRIVCSEPNFAKRF